jgi:hypothetical protein
MINNMQELMAAIAETKTEGYLLAEEYFRKVDAEWEAQNQKEAEQKAVGSNENE